MSQKMKLWEAGMKLIDFDDNKNGLRYGSYKIILFLLVIFRHLVNKMVEIDLVAQETSQSCEALEELSTFWRLVCHELNLAPVIFVVNG